MKKQIKVCQNCDSSFEDKSPRQNAVYCSNACKQEKYRQRNGIQPPTFFKKQETLTENKELGIVTSNAKYNPLKIEIQNSLQVKLVEQNFLMEAQKRIINRINELEQKNYLVASSTVGGGGLGALIAKAFGANDFTATAAGIVGLGLGYVTGYEVNENVKKANLKKIQDLEQEYLTNFQSLLKIDRQITILNNLDAKTPKYLTQEKKEPETLKNSVKTESLIKIEPKKEIDFIKIPEKQNSNIVNSIELQKMEFQELDFKGKSEEWYNFLGNPSENFFMLVYGNAGNGKSSFAYKFSEFLANNFGKALYIAGEEGISKTTQNKANLYGATSEYLDFTDLSGIEKIREVAKSGFYRFLVFDSINHLDISPQELENLRTEFPKQGFICVFQATKNGYIRGSGEYAHNSDIIIKVENGMASTIKNRFAQLSFFKVF